MPRLKNFLLALLAAGASAAEIPWDHDWLFHLGDAPGAEAAGFADGDWRPLDLPHDWSIEGATDPAAPTKGDGGFFPTGVGWYRKKFTAPETWRGQKAWIEFDGVYRNSEVWLNGTSLGRRPYGFVPFRYDLTLHLKVGGENILAVRVDNSAQPTARFYTGSGINRHVRLRVAEPLHIEPDSLVVTTEALTPNSATLRISLTVRNDTASSPDCRVQLELLDPQGRTAAFELLPAQAGAGSDLPVSQKITLRNPQPWSPATPGLYRAVARLRTPDREVDRTEITFGIRTVKVSAERGLELNGGPVKLLGGNAHSDSGPLGTAAFDRAEERRAELLKAAGFTAVRTGHNPPAAAFLAACDRLGLLVVEEAFDGWKNRKIAQDYSRDFDEWWQRDLDAMILRDRNHPAIVMWDVGNEPYERGRESGAAIAKKLADRARELDPTRPVTAAINGLGNTGVWSGLDPVFAALDVAGYNYELAHHADDHARLPARVMQATESYHADVFPNWSIMQAQPYVVGDFVWGALDYLGEAGIGRVFPPDEEVRPHWVGSHYPWHGAATGDSDLTGWRRPSSHYRNIVWDRGEKLYAAVRETAPDGRALNPSKWAPPHLQASWTWPGADGRELSVEVYSRHGAVRLYLNDKLLGEKPTTIAEEFKTVFAVPYAPGTLRAVGVDAGRESETFTLATAGAPARLRLTADRSALQAGGQDLAFVTVEVTDDAGRVVPQAADSITYALGGPGAIAAIGSADLTTTETYRANPRRVHQGRALVVVRTSARAGEITLTASAPGLASSSLALKSKIPSELASSSPPDARDPIAGEAGHLGLNQLATTLNAREAGPISGSFSFASPVYRGPGGALKFANAGPHVTIAAPGGKGPAAVSPPITAAAARVRVSSEITHSALFTPGQSARLRFAPNVIIKNELATDLFVSLIDRGSVREQVAFARLEVRDANGVSCQVAPLDSRPVESNESATLPPGDERPFSLPTEYDLTIPRPGKYRVTISVAFAGSQLGAKQFFITSEPFEIEVLATQPVL